MKHLVEKYFIRNGALRRAALIAVTLVGLVAGAVAETFLSGLEDVPLMVGLVEVEGSAFTFDKPQGRIVEVRAIGKVTRAQVLEFYDETLPQLGWRALGGGRFGREGETLRLDFEPAGKAGLSVRFSLVPDGGA